MVDLISTHLQFTEDTEPPTEYHRWAFLSCAGAALGRNVWVPFGHGKIYPNMYTMLVGVPGTRKSTAIKIAQNLLREAQYGTFAYSKTSKQKFLLDLQEGFCVQQPDGTTDFSKLLDIPIRPDQREVFVCCDEFADFIGIGNIEFISLLTTLWDNQPSYEERLKNSSSVNIRNPTCNLLGGMTPTSFAQCMPKEVVGQGFMSRLILVYGQPPKRRITWPSPPDENIAQLLSASFVELTKMGGEVAITKAARQLVDSIYQQWDNLPDVRLQYYGARRLTHLLKLCIICACLRKSQVITDEVVEQANSILSYTEQGMHHALGEFGDARNSAATQKVMEVLSSAPGPVTTDYLWKSVSQDLDKMNQLMEILTSLKRADKIILADGSGTQEGMALITINRALKTRNTTGVNYEKWIWEYEKTLIPPTKA